MWRLPTSCTVAKYPHADVQALFNSHRTYSRKVLPKLADKARLSIRTSLFIATYNRTLDSQVSLHLVCRGVGAVITLMMDAYRKRSREDDNNEQDEKKTRMWANAQRDGLHRCSHAHIEAGPTVCFLRGEFVFVWNFEDVVFWNFRGSLFTHSEPWSGAWPEIHYLFNKCWIRWWWWYWPLFYAVAT